MQRRGVEAGANLDHRAAAQIDRILGPGSKIADSAQLETLLAHADIKDARMLQDLLRHPGPRRGRGQRTHPRERYLTGSGGGAWHIITGFPVP